MRKCSGNNTEEWGFDSIFDIECPNCGASVEFFKDEIRRYCPECREPVYTIRDDLGCGQWCSTKSGVMNLCPRFRRSKARFSGYRF